VGAKLWASGMAGASRRGYGEDGIYFDHRDDCRDSTHHQTCSGRWRGVVSLGYLTRALRHAEGRDLVRRNVSALVDTPRGREGRPPQALTVEQAAALLEAAEDSRLHAYIVLCLLTGVRSEEARALTWNHVDLDAKTISVWRSVRAGDGRLAAAVSLGCQVPVITAATWPVMVVRPMSRIRP
jgi:integrase